MLRNPLRTNYLKMILVVRIPVAVEKLAFSEESRNLGDRKCLGDSGKSFIELPDAKQFLRNRSDRVFQQPPLFSTPIFGFCEAYYENVILNSFW
jgi:hypothetical protein